MTIPEQGIERREQDAAITPWTAPVEARSEVEIRRSDPAEYRLFAVPVQMAPDDEALFRSLRRRLLVADAGNGEWKLRVPLMQRWLRERG